MAVGMHRACTGSKDSSSMTQHQHVARRSIGRIWRLVFVLGGLATTILMLGVVRFYGSRSGRSLHKALVAATESRPWAYESEVKSPDLQRSGPHRCCQDAERFGSLSEAGRSGVWLTCHPWNPAERPCADFRSPRYAAERDRFLAANAELLAATRAFAACAGASASGWPLTCPASVQVQSVDYSRLMTARHALSVALTAAVDANDSERAGALLVDMFALAAHLEDAAFTQEEAGSATVESVFESLYWRYSWLLRSTMYDLCSTLAHVRVPQETTREIMRRVSRLDGRAWLALALDGIAAATLKLREESGELPWVPDLGRGTLIGLGASNDTWDLIHAELAIVTRMRHATFMSYRDVLDAQESESQALAALREAAARHGYVPLVAEWRLRKHVKSVLDVQALRQIASLILVDATLRTTERQETVNSRGARLSRLAELFPDPATGGPLRVEMTPSGTWLVSAESLVAPGHPDTPLATAVVSHWLRQVLEEPSQRNHQTSSGPQLWARSIQPQLMPLPALSCVVR